MSAYFMIQQINRHRLKVDGKGVTTLVGLFGCPLKCKYCLNMNFLSVNKYRKVTPEELWKQLEIDYCYYVASGGGVTFGGGESLLHAAAIMEFINIIPEGVTVNLETSLNAAISDKLFEKVIDAVINKGGELIIDIKSLDKDIYKSYTGLNNDKVIRRLNILLAKKYQEKCIIRIPVIPNYKDRIVASAEADKIKEIGFGNIDLFDYVIRDYMVSNEESSSE